MNVDVKELVFRYLSMNEMLRPSEIRDKIKSEHKIKITDQQSSAYRVQYFKSIGKECRKLLGSGHFAPSKYKHNQSREKIVARPAAKSDSPKITLDVLQSFAQSVKDIGGVSVASKLLSIFE